MDKEKSAKLREAFNTITSCVKNEIAVLETETINWRTELAKVLKADRLLALDINGLKYTGAFLEIGLKELEKEFNPDYGSYQGVDFCAWSANFVIFTEEEDGHRWLRVINRNPGTIETK